MSFHTSSNVRTAPLPSNQFRWWSRTKSGFKPMHMFACPSYGLIKISIARRWSGLYFRWSSHMQHIVYVAGGLPFDAIDCVEGNATIFSFVGPHNILKTQMSATALILHMVLDGFRWTATKIHPSVLSRRIGFKLGTFEDFHCGTQ